MKKESRIHIYNDIYKTDGYDANNQIDFFFPLSKCIKLLAFIDCHYDLSKKIMKQQIIRIITTMRPFFLSGEMQEIRNTVLSVKS